MLCAERENPWQDILRCEVFDEGETLNVGAFIVHVFGCLQTQSQVVGVSVNYVADDAEIVVKKFVELAAETLDFQ